MGKGTLQTNLDGMAFVTDRQTGLAQIASPRHPELARHRSRGFETILFADGIYALASFGFADTGADKLTRLFPRVTPHAATADWKFWCAGYNCSAPRKRTNRAHLV
ncbi:hypothetical protein TNIN_442121 [Trichonephila inaurata madagascariensis]|uniref:Uncharacterized protein n=1 Tax=Trichonephila inaurata madagascariensis TaxID=2747483 RepID=A0A8X6X0I5_9ARAC|nr:hypothetical protein TNIN_442121 [Trichonephila inaurata madagascariensis]